MYSQLVKCRKKDTKHEICPSINKHFIRKLNKYYECRRSEACDEIQSSRLMCMKNTHPSTRLWLYIVQYPGQEVRDFREGTSLNRARGAVAVAVG